MRHPPSAILTIPHPHGSLTSSSSPSSTLSSNLPAVISPTTLSPVHLPFGPPRCDESSARGATSSSSSSLRHRGVDPPTHTEAPTSTSTPTPSELRRGCSESESASASDRRQGRLRAEREREATAVRWTSCRQAADAGKEAHQTAAAARRRSSRRLGEAHCRRARHIHLRFFTQPAASSVLAILEERHRTFQIFQVSKLFSVRLITSVLPYSTFGLATCQLRFPHEFRQGIISLILAQLKVETKPLCIT